MNYSTVAIIYNPNSTGPSKDLALDFQRRLAERSPDQKVELMATERAGHAEELAYEIAKTNERPLIISSSGDGGYHELVNGALRAQREGAQPTTGLLPGGNANDHYHNIHDIDAVDAVVQGKERQIDILKLMGCSDGKPFERYAHSYIGFGITPVVGEELNRYKLNFFNQLWIVLRGLFVVKPIRLTIGGKTGYYESIIMSNVDKMSKVLKVSQPSRLNDGQFEVTMIRRRHKLRLILLLLHATVAGLKEDVRVDSFSLRTVVPTLVQADGEVTKLDASTDVTVSIEHTALRCIV